MYGERRLTVPLLRMKDGRFARDGELTPVTWEQALAVMAKMFRQALRGNGPSAIAMSGSGGWTIWEGYAAAKLMKAGFRSDNIQPDTRHGAASAPPGCIRTFGVDERLACCDDLARVDAFALWGSSMAPLHPILWARLVDRRLSAPHVRVAVLSTFEHRGFELADIPIVLRPQTEVAILNYIANHIIRSGRVNAAFVREHVIFRRGPAGIGYGLGPEPPLGPAAANADEPRDGEPISFADYQDLVSGYTLERAHELSGIPRHRLEALAAIYADPTARVMSVSSGDRKSRGRWRDRLLDSIHLLAGKVAGPGTTSFSLTPLPSVCGAAREVGAWAPRPPADLLATGSERRAMAEQIWRLPAGVLADATGCHAPLGNRMRERAGLGACWSQCRDLDAAPDGHGAARPGERDPKSFVVVSAPYPSISAQAADLILPTAVSIEKESAYGIAEPRTRFRRQLVEAPGEARSQLWQTVELAKRFTTDEVWPQEVLDPRPEYRGKTLYQVLFANGQVDRHPLDELDPAYRNHESEAFGFYIQRGLFEEYAMFERGHGPGRARSEAALEKEPEGHGNPSGRARIHALP
jgi:nitrate reductase NapA